MERREREGGRCGRMRGWTMESVERKKGRKRGKGRRRMEGRRKKGRVMKGRKRESIRGVLAPSKMSWRP